MQPSPMRLNSAHGGFGHENWVYLSGAGVLCIMVVLLWQGMDQKIRMRRQLRHVTILQDYLSVRILIIREKKYSFVPPDVSRESKL
jgi:hypothetical protein